jgi:hypothetical protein
MRWEDFIIADDGQIAVFWVQEIATREISKKGKILGGVENLSPKDKRVHFSGVLVISLTLCGSCMYLPSFWPPPYHLNT